MRRAVLRRLPLYTSALLLALGFAAVWEATDWSTGEAWLIGVAVLTVYFAAVAVPLILSAHDASGADKGGESTNLHSVGDIAASGKVIVIGVEHPGRSHNGESGGVPALRIRPKSTTAADGGLVVAPPPSLRSAN